MAYQALARKWRPQDFTSLVGQEPVVRALRNALTEGRIAQAYLFAGIRGVGKTSAARILAKALNCERGPAADPCNECLPCREITTGSDLDVLEVDAATYSKVEQVRELTESLRYGPARDRYKVVVLDEVHRLSRQAFDALLKIIEEPPPHLVFIFATTEIESVPATVLSRCQEYRFRRVPVPVVAEYLREIAEAESIQVSSSALHLVARAGEGSVRDAVALLDQLATFGNGTIADEEAARLVGSFDLDLYHRLLAAMLAGDGRTVTEELAELETRGGDPRQLFAGLLTYVRDALHLALGSELAGRDLPDEQSDRLTALAESTGYENLLRLLQNLLASENMVRRSEAPGLALELGLLRAAELPRLTAVEELLGSGSTTGKAGRDPGTSSGKEPRGTGPGNRGGGKSAAGGSEVVLGAASGRDAPSKQERSRGGDRSGPSTGGSLSGFLQSVRSNRQMLAAHLAEAQDLSFSDGTLTIVRPPADPWLPQALERSGNRRALEDSLRETFGEDATWRLVDGRESSPGIPPAENTGGAEPDSDHPGLQSVLEIFDGAIRTEHADDEG
ncbi:MAG: DNA polymerase III subunit gamma/tau [Thermoanaerobaculia bacterium]|nr:DNA polymerase III subunit gamma/tau [Thermoanaerobaculia bacterium]